MLLYIRIWFSTLFHHNMLISLSAKEIMSGCATLLFLASSGRFSEVSSFSRLPSHLHELDSGSFSILLLPYFIARMKTLLVASNLQSFILSHQPTLSLPCLSIERISFYCVCQFLISYFEPKNWKNISVPSLWLLVYKLIRLACPLTFPKIYNLWRYHLQLFSYLQKTLILSFRKDLWSLLDLHRNLYLLDSIAPNHQISFLIQKQHP